MKNVLLITLLVTGLVACDDNNNDTNPNVQAQISEVESVAKEGQWIVTYFWDEDEDETSYFTGYKFVFASNGTLTATNGTTTATGQWSVTGDDNGKNDDNDKLGDVDFNIRFSTPANFEELSEDWEILSLTAAKIELKHVSGGNGGTYFLTFEKD
jgi:hypothetical protein